MIKALLDTAVLPMLPGMAAEGAEGTGKKPIFGVRRQSPHEWGRGRQECLRHIRHNLPRKAMR